MNNSGLLHMNHNYKITDFKKPEFESDTDLADISVTVCLRNPLELPSVLEKRLEDIINNLISECEQENNIIIPLEDMDLENCITVDTDSNELFIEAFIGYDVTKELLHKKEVVAATDEHYGIIKKFFFGKLNDYVSEQIKKIEECVQ